MTLQQRESLMWCAVTVSVGGTFIMIGLGVNVWLATGLVLTIVPLVTRLIRWWCS